MHSNDSKIGNPLFGGLSTETFLQEYWQQKPLLVQNALPDYRCPVSPEMLMQFACEEDVEARLIQQIEDQQDWQLDYGPFDMEDFEHLPATHWTVLVQQVNRLHPEIRALLNLFSFLPRWRIDDIMISYAPHEGGVGPHVDNYDVFLIQGRGQRRWQIDPVPVKEENLIPDLDVSILSDFEAKEDWILNPGDMLYLPPRVAHNGISMGNCMTLSVGFRAPSFQDMITGYFLDLAEQVDPLERYNDAGIQPTPNPGLIDPTAIQRVMDMLTRHQPDIDGVTNWFGKHVTRATRDYYPPFPDQERDPAGIERILREGKGVKVDSGLHAAYARTSDQELSFFVNGMAFPLPSHSEPLVQSLSTGAVASAKDVLALFNDGAIANCLVSLINDGFIQFEEKSD